MWTSRKLWNLCGLQFAPHACCSEASLCLLYLISLFWCNANGNPLWWNPFVWKCVELLWMMLWSLMFPYSPMGGRPPLSGLHERHKADLSGCFLPRQSHSVQMLSTKACFLFLFFLHASGKVFTPLYFCRIETSIFDAFYCSFMQ